MYAYLPACLSVCHSVCLPVSVCVSLPLCMIVCMYVGAPRLTFAIVIAKHAYILGLVLWGATPIYKDWFGTTNKIQAWFGGTTHKLQV